MDDIIQEAIDYLESWDIEPTKEKIKRVLNNWIENLYSHVGEEAHIHEVECGVEDLTGFTWEEQDIQILKQIEDYENCLAAM